MEKTFKNYFQKFISTIFLAIIIVTFLVAFFTIKKIAYPILLKKEQENILNIGKSIVLELENKIKNAETLSLDLASIYKVLDKKNSIFMKVIPNILNLPGYENIIAGGGIWPEPYTFDKKSLYRSFFWGRDKNGALKYYNDYNNPNSNGYFHEEWYVPLKYLNASKVYWSRSYIDPYSKQPMVTCSSPIKKGKVFLGVATVDLKLDGLEKLFSYYGKEIQGYIFVVDRENNFLYFPENKLIQEKNSNSKKYINLSDFVKKFNQFTNVEKKIEFINKTFIDISKKQNKNFNKIAANIAKNSYQISIKQAQLITAILNEPLKNTNIKKFLLKNLTVKIKDDIIFNTNTTCTIFLMPETYWKIGVVVPDKLIIALTNQITGKIIFYLVISLITILLIGYYIIKQRLIIPLRKITSQLSDTINEKKIFVDYKSNDELGKLVYYLNMRTKKLFESEAYIKSIFSQSPIAIQIFDKNGIAIDANKAWEKLWLVKKEDFNGKYNIFKDKILKKTGEFKNFQEVFKGKTVIIKNFYYKLKTYSKLGRDRILNIVMFPIKDNNSNIVRVVIMQEDITDKVKMQESIQKISQLEALGELSAGIAHDFNNILTSISLNLEMLEIKIKPDKNLTKFFEKIKKAIDSAKNLINKIKMTSRDKKIKMSPCCINDIIKETISIVKPTISKNIKIEINIMEENLWIAGDKYNLHQLIMNLILNARDAINSAKREEGLIKVALSRINNFAVLTISDNGTGISNEIKDKIFEPFFTTKQKSENRGTGLGLSIAYNIVLMHKGEITLDSIESEGTRFIIKLPLIDYNGKKVKNDNQEIKIKNELLNKKVLLVEDEEDIRLVEKEILQILGFEVLEAENGKEAIEIFKKEDNIDVVLIDWNMPVIDGKDCILSIRKISKDVPIIVISGAISKEIENFQSKKLINGTINKPFTKEDIIKKLNLII